MVRALNRWIVICAAGALLFALMAFFFPSDSSAAIQQYDKYIPLCEYIDIELLQTDVEIIPYEGDKLRLAYRSEVPIKVKRGDNTLKISESDKFYISFLSGDTANYGLYLYVPQTAFRELTVYTSSGNVRIGGVNCDRITAVTNSGSITAENTVSRSHLTTGTGDTSLEFDLLVRGCEIQTRSGNAHITVPQGSSSAVVFETETGGIDSELIHVKLLGSGTYGFNGGAVDITAIVEQGILTVAEKNNETEE